MTEVCTLIIDASPIWEKWKPRPSSPDNSVEARVWVSLLPLFSGSEKRGHHRIVTDSEQQYSFVPRSHAILTLLCFWDFVPFI